MALDGGEELASRFHHFTLGEKGLWDSLDRKLDNTETKLNPCIINQMSFSLQPLTLLTMIRQLRQLLHLFPDLQSLYTKKILL
jgi:hypothetical protein